MDWSKVEFKKTKRGNGGLFWFGCVCFLMGWYFATQIHGPEPTGPEAAKAGPPKTNLDALQPRTPSPISSVGLTNGSTPNLLIPPEPVPRLEIILSRETNAAQHAGSLLQDRQDEIWSRLSQLGMPDTNIESAFKALVEQQKLYFIAEAALVDLLKVRSELQQLLTNSLPPASYQEFVKGERSLPAQYIVSDIVGAAASRQIEITDQELEEIRGSILAAGAFPAATGGPFGPLPEPAFGAEESQTYLSHRADRLEAAANNFYKAISSKVSSELFGTIQSVYAELISRDRNALARLQDSEKRMEQLMREGGRSLKPQSP